MALIETHELTKRYPGGVTALDDADARRWSRGSSAWSGANGAGKSTLLKILLGLLQPTSGTPPCSDFDAFRQARDPRPRRLHAGARLPAAGPDRAEFVTHMGEMAGLPPHRRARARPPTSCVMSGSTRSATARSAATRPA